MIARILTKKRSLGKLRVTRKTKERSPDMTGTLYLQRHTAAAIAPARFGVEKNCPPIRKRTH
jgi:hypothetical protein